MTRVICTQREKLRDVASPLPTKRKARENAARALPSRYTPVCSAAAANCGVIDVPSALEGRTAANSRQQHTLAARRRLAASLAALLLMRRSLSPRSAAENQPGSCGNAIVHLVRERQTDKFRGTTCGHRSHARRRQRARVCTAATTGSKRQRLISSHAGVSQCHLPRKRYVASEAQGRRPLKRRKSPAGTAPNVVRS